MERDVFEDCLSELGFTIKKRDLGIEMDAGAVAEFDYELTKNGKNYLLCVSESENPRNFGTGQFQRKYTQMKAALRQDSYGQHVPMMCLISSEYARKHHHTLKQYFDNYAPDFEWAVLVSDSVAYWSQRDEMAEDLPTKAPGAWNRSDDKRYEEKAFTKHDLLLLKTIYHEAIPNANQLYEQTTASNGKCYEFVNELKNNGHLIKQGGVLKLQNVDGLLNEWAEKYSIGQNELVTCLGITRAEIGEALSEFQSDLLLTGPCAFECYCSEEECDGPFELYYIDQNTDYLYEELKQYQVEPQEADVIIYESDYQQPIQEWTKNLGDWEVVDPIQTYLDSVNRTGVDGDGLRTLL
jgi:hypothetical protein